MATFTVGDVRNRAQRETSRLRKSMDSALTEAVKAQTITKSYDIFLSHSLRDAQLILGVKLKLQDYGYSVYVDWIEDPQLDRSSVTLETASILRSQMDCCRSLFYATTPTSSESKWMPWECGYFDGKKSRTAILPITPTPDSYYSGREYLGLYPYITEEPLKGLRENSLRVHISSTVYCLFDRWLEGKEPTPHRG